MNKPLTMLIKETKDKLASTCNESELPLSILDLILQGLYSEVHYLAEKQFVDEKVSYEKSLATCKKDGKDKE